MRPLNHRENHRFLYFRHPRFRLRAVSGRANTGCVRGLGGAHISRNIFRNLPSRPGERNFPKYRLLGSARVTQILIWTHTHISATLRRPPGLDSLSSNVVSEALRRGDKNVYDKLLEYIAEADQIFADARQEQEDRDRLQRVADALSDASTQQAPRVRPAVPQPPRVQTRAAAARMAAADAAQRRAAQPVLVPRTRSQKNNAIVVD